jgi:hypothetical protein
MFLATAALFGTVRDGSMPELQSFPPECEGFLRLPLELHDRLEKRPPAYSRHEWPVPVDICQTAAAKSALYDGRKSLNALSCDAYRFGQV